MHFATCRCYFKTVQHGEAGRGKQVKIKECRWCQGSTVSITQSKLTEQEGLRIQAMDPANMPGDPAETLDVQTLLHAGFLMVPDLSVEKQKADTSCQKCITNNKGRKVPSTAVFVDKNYVHFLYDVQKFYNLQFSINCQDHILRKKKSKDTLKIMRN